MKINPGIPAPHGGTRSIAATAVTMLAAAMFSTQAYAQLPAVQHEVTVEYVSGGIGQNESTAFKQAMSSYPLAMTFASRIGDRNAYASDVQVAIRDARDRNVLDVTSKGPYLLVKLPPGKYRVSATYENKTRSQEVSIGAEGTSRVVFEWNEP